MTGEYLQTGFSPLLILTVMLVYAIYTKMYVYLKNKTNPANYHMSGALRVQKSILGPLELVIDGWEPPCGCWGQNLGLLHSKCLQLLALSSSVPLLRWQFLLLNGGKTKLRGIGICIN